MGKVFITDEVNDMYTADVTNASKVKVEDAAALFVALDSARTTKSTSGQYVATAPCYLKNVIIGHVPATATTLSFYNTTTSASDLSAFGSSGDHIIGRLDLDTASASNFPKTIPFNVYCTSGLIAAIGEGQDYAVASGCAKQITVTYQT